jgi:hypothetical protein
MKRGMAERCRLCTANDLDALTDELAERLWNSRRDREIDPPWQTASPYWHQAMLQFARSVIEMLKRDHGRGD